MSQQNLNRQWRPNPTGDPRTDLVERRTYDLLYDQRNNFGPHILVSRGTPNADPVTVSNSDTGIGLTVRLDRPGTWLVSCNVSLSIDSDPSQLFSVSLHVQGTRQPYFSNLKSATDGVYILTQNWSIFSQFGNDLCVLYILKDGGSGTSAVDPVNSTLTATWQGTVDV